MFQVGDEVYINVDVLVDADEFRARHAQYVDKDENGLIIGVVEDIWQCEYENEFCAANPIHVKFTQNGVYQGGWWCCEAAVSYRTKDRLYVSRQLVSMMNGG